MEEQLGHPSQLQHKYMIQIPQVDKKFTIKNTGTALGNIVGSFNLDLYTNMGKVRVSPRSLLNTLAPDGIPVAFRFLQDRWYSIAGTKIFKSTNATLNPADYLIADAVAGTPTTDSGISDMEVFNSLLYVTATGTEIYKHDPSGGGSWSHFAGPSSTSPKLLCAFSNRLYMTYGSNKIISWDSADTVATIGSPNTITVGIPGSTVITWMKSTQNRIFIGTYETLPGRSNVYVWDGVQSTNFDSIIKIMALSTLSCTVMNDIPYVMDCNGYLLKYNGAYFVEIGRLPLPAGRLLSGAASLTNDRAIHPNGMTIVRGKINILVNTSMPVVQEYCPSGVWEFDEDIGLYHKTSVSYAGSQISTNNSILDYSQWNLAGVGAIVDANTNNTDTSPARNGNILYGVKYYTDATTTGYAIMTNDFIQICDKIGYFITPEMYSENIEIFTRSNYQSICINSTCIC